MTTDWRSDVLSSLPEHKRTIRLVTFTSAGELIEEAAWNRRMSTEEFCGRAALAVACFDSGIPWGQATRGEPPLFDRRRKSMPPRRKRGRDFGNWTITEMT